MNTTKNISKINHLTLVHSGEDFFYRLERFISNAKTEIHIQTYIFENDSIGKKIIKKLKEAASRNVKVYILLDGFGSFSFPEKTINELKKNGINIRFFSPFFSANTIYLGRRLHHKIIVIDSEIVLIGGINIAEKYLGTPTKLAWLDYAIEIIDSKIAQSVRKLCMAIYYRKKRVDQQKIASIYNQFDETTVKILQNDWLKRKSEISTAYIKSIRNAKEEIIIVGSYFLPGRRLINALKKSSKNKVKIKLILSGVSDVPMARRASCYLYAKLLRLSIEIYEWDKSILHGKTAVVDRKWTTIGSFNLNNLSSFASIEMNVGINSEEFSKEFLLHLDEIMAQSKRITPESLKIANGIFTQFMNWISYWLTRTIEIIITYLPHKRFIKLY